MIVRRCHCENPDVPHRCPEFSAAYRAHLAASAVSHQEGRVRHVGEVARRFGLVVAGVVAVWLAFVYTFGGGYFPGGPMHFPGDDNFAALAVTGAFLVVLGVGGALWSLWDGVLSHRISRRASDRIDEALVGVGTTLLFLYPVFALGGLVAYLLLA
jgi:hypothetical protein